MNLFTKIIAVSLFASALAQAEDQTIKVMGVDVVAKNISYFSGTTIINRFDVVTPVSFPLPRGNSIRATDTVYLHKNGVISTISSTQQQEIVWKAANGMEVKLDCSIRPDSIERPKSARLISFYENGEYKTGCNAYNGAKFTTQIGNEITVFGDIDTTADFKLLYARQVGNGYVTAGDTLVHLMPGTEVAFYPNGIPRFFTLIHGEKFSVNNSIYGKITFTQKEGKHTSTSLFENGKVAMGILDQELLFKKAGILIAKGNGLAFSNTNDEITDIIYTQPTDIQVKGYAISAKAFSVDGNTYTLFVAKEFNFTNPSTGKVIFVPMGSQVTLSLTMEIIGIRIPRTENPPVAPELN